MWGRCRRCGGWRRGCGGDGGTGPLACSSAGSLPPAEPEGLAVARRERRARLRRSARAKSLALASSISTCRSCTRLGRCGGPGRRAPARGPPTSTLPISSRSGHLATGPVQEHGQVEHPLDVADRRRPPAERDPPGVALARRRLLVDSGHGWAGGFCYVVGEQRLVEGGPGDGPEVVCMSSAARRWVTASSWRPSAAASVARWWSTAPP